MQIEKELAYSSLHLGKYLLVVHGQHFGSISNYFQHGL